MLNMEKLKSVSFEHGGQQYEIIVSRSDNRYRIQALLDNKPVNPWIYWVEYVNNVDFGLKFGVSACDQLIEIAKSDVVENRWEELKKHSGESG